MSLRYVREELESIYSHFRNLDHYNEAYELYCDTVQTKWEYSQERPYKGDVLVEPRRIYIHYYYNIEKAADEEKAFDRKLLKLRRELENNERNPKHEAQYKEYFEVKTTPKRGTKAIVKEEAVQQVKGYVGFFALMTNETMDAITALEVYRNKDLVDKGFQNLKDRLNLRRTLVSSEQSLDGKLFVEFLALIYHAYLKKQMQDAHLFKEYTLQEMIDKLDVIECFEKPGRHIQMGELLEKQKNIYKKLGIEPPTSL